MVLIDKIILAIGGTLILLLALVSLAIVPGGIFVDNVIAFFDYLKVEGHLEAAISGILFLIVSLALFRLIIKHSNGAHIVLKETSLGDIRISLSTIHQLTEEAMHQFNQVREATKIKLNTSPDGLEVDVTLRVLPDSCLPDLCEEAQMRLKDYLNSTVGIIPKRVRIYVQDVAREKTLKVE